MKIPSLLVALLVSASTTVNAESTCSEDSGVCICSGSCPSFTSSWGSSTLLGGSCIANKSGDNNVSVEGDIPMSVGEVLMVNNIKYTYPFDACPASNGGGDAVPNDATTTDDEKDDDTTTDGGDDDDTTEKPVTTTSGGESYTINGVKGKLQFTTDTCKYGTNVQCAVASGPLCKNNMCASTTSTCDDASGGCLSLMGKAEACNKPANICGDGYCGTPPTYSNCQCKDNKCYGMKFVPDDGSAPIMGDVEGGIQGTIISTSPGAVTVGSWFVGGVAILAAVVGW